MLKDESEGVPFAQNEVGEGDNISIISMLVPQRKHSPTNLK